MSSIQKASSVGCMVLFALPFAAVGIGTGGTAFWMIVQSIQASSWDRVPARIVSTDLARNDDSDGGSTYSCEATYEYVLDGNTILGDRVGLLSMSDNIGSWHERKHEELRRLQQAGEPVICYVDPDDAWNAVLFPEVRLEMLAFLMLFALMFGGVGFGIIVAALWQRRSARTEGVLEAHHPGEPWLWREEWAGGRVVSGTRGSVAVAAIVALAWNAISAPVLFFVPEEVRDGNELALIALVFPLVGLCLIAWALHAFARWRKYGESILQLQTIPAYAGGRLNGVVHVNRNLPVPPNGFGLRLVCVRKIVTRSSDGTSTSERVLWEDEQRILQELAPQDSTCTLIPVSFRIPPEIEESRPSDGSGAITWRLEVTAEVPGVDYSGRFDVPVFEPRGDVDLEALGQTQDLAESVRGETSAADQLQAAGVRARERIGGGLELYYPPARNLGMAIGVTIFCIVWTGAIVLMLRLRAPILFPIVFGLFDLLLLYGVIVSWLGSWWVEVTRYSITVSRRVLGLGRARILQAEEITGIDCKSNMQSGETSYYTIEVSTADGKKHPAGDGIRGQSAAEAVIAEMRMAMQGR